MTADIHMPFFSNINLDLVKTQAWVPQQIFATEGDNGYGQIFSLYENGNPYTSATVANLNFRAIKPDSNVVDIKGGTGFKAIDGQSNQFAFQVPAQTFQATGRVECYFYVTNSENTIVASTTHFFYEVQRSVPSETGSVSYIASLEGIINDANALKKQASDLVAGLSESKTNASTMVNDFQRDLVSKEQDIDNQAKQMLADAKTALDKATGAATDYQQKLDDLNKQYISKYNELLAQLPSASDAVKKQISDALAQIKDDEQDEFQKISMDWVNKKQALDDSITTYKDSVTKELDALKQQIAGLSGDNVAQLAKQIDDLQTKLNSMKLSDYYTKKEIDDKLDNYQPSIDLSSYETSAHAEQTYAKKSDIVAPDLSGYETKTDAEQTYAKKTDIPASPDLSDYAKSTDVAKTYETKADAATHITKETADATYANKADIPDLSDYAKKSDIPKGQDLSAYETKEDAESTYAKKTDIPAPQDLTSYAKTEDIAKTYETKEDASTHLTKEDAQSTYATKDDLANVKPDLTGYAKTSDIPDVSGFETASHAEQTYETKTDAEQTYAKKTDIPSAPDLSEYAKKSDIPAVPDMSGYETKTDADATYAKKADIPASQDLSAYAKTADVAKTYETKDDASNTFVSHIQVARNETGGRSEDNTNYAEIWVAPNSYETTGGYFDLSSTDHAFPAMLTVDTSFYKDPDNKAAIAASSNSRYNGYIFKEDDKFFLSGKQLITNDDLSTKYATASMIDEVYAKKSDMPNMLNYLTTSNADMRYAKKSDIPAAPDLTSYLTKTDADTTYAKKSDIPTVPDMSSYLTKTDASSTYATKDELKNANTGSDPDLSKYLTKTDADNTYLKKGNAVTKITTYSGSLSGYMGWDKKYQILRNTTDLRIGSDGSINVTGPVTGAYAFPSILNGDNLTDASLTDDYVKSALKYQKDTFFLIGTRLFGAGHRILTDDDAKTFATKSDIPKLTAYKSNVELSVQTTTLTPDSSNGYNATSEEIALPSVVTVKNSGYAYSNSMNYPNMIFMSGKDLYINGNKYSPSAM